MDSIQYELIDKQFDCMAKYLSWDMIFQKSYYATASDELAMQDATGVWVQNYWYLPFRCRAFQGELPPIQDAELMQELR